MSAPADELTDVAPRRSHGALIAAVAVGLVTALLWLVLSNSKAATDRAVSSPLLGQVAPAIDATALDGGRFDLDGLRGQWVVVNFFATWCVPCRTEHPELASFERRHAQAGDAAVVSIVFDDQPDAVRDFFAANGGDWPVVVGSEGQLALDYGVAGVPESFLVDPTGIVRYKLVGGVTSTGLDRLLGEAEGRGS